MSYNFIDGYLIIADRLRIHKKEILSLIALPILKNIPIIPGSELLMRRKIKKELK
jgi:hypothetical protein